MRRDGQPQPGSAVTARGGTIGLGECLEDDSLLLRWNADSGIGDGETQPGVAVAARLGLHPQHNLPMLREFDGIAHKIDHYLAEAQRISDQRFGHVRMDVARQLKTFLVSAWSQHAHGVFEGITKIEPDAIQL